MSAPNISEWLDWYGRMLVPHLLIAGLFLLNLVLLPIPVGGPDRPYFLLMAVFYWAVYRPTLISPAYVFLLGLLMDFLCGMPTGLNAFILVATQWIIRDQRRAFFGQPFITLWTGFAFVCLGASLAKWILFGFINARAWPPVEPVLATAILSIVIFPLIAILLFLTHRILPRRASSAETGTI